MTENEREQIVLFVSAMRGQKRIKQLYAYEALDYIELLLGELNWANMMIMKSNDERDKYKSFYDNCKSCQTCADLKTCKYRSELSTQVYINCPHWKNNNILYNIAKRFTKSPCYKCSMTTSLHACDLEDAKNFKFECEGKALEDCRKKRKEKLRGPEGLIGPKK